jgi:hypothetical protein
MNLAQNLLHIIVPARLFRQHELFRQRKIAEIAYYAIDIRRALVHANLLLVEERTDKYFINSYIPNSHLTVFYNRSLDFSPKPAKYI